MSRLREEMSSVPPTTLAVIALCSAVYCCQMLFSLPLEHFTLCPRLILHNYEVHRVVTHALFHANFLHIAMNMLSTFAISSAVEKRVGTLYHLLSIFVSIVTISIVYIGISLLLLLLGSKDLFSQHAVGFSSVLFHLLVLDVTGSSRSRSLFGMVEVPALFYPFALLLVLQLILPNISFHGHLSGILTGFLQSSGFLNGVLVTDEQRLQNMEDWSVLNTLTRSPAFVPANPEVATLGAHNRPIVQIVTQAVEGIMRWTAQIFHRFQRHVYHPTASTEESADGDWNGLPIGEPSAQEFV